MSRKVEKVIHDDLVSQTKMAKSLTQLLHSRYKSKATVMS